MTARKKKPAASNTGKKQGKKPKGQYRVPPASTRFKPNNPVTGERDERINRKGRPRTADALKVMVLEILNASSGGPKSKAETNLKKMIKRMIDHGTATDRGEILNRAFGKATDEISLTYDDLKKIMPYLPDDVLQQIGNGTPVTDAIIAFIVATGKHGQINPPPA